MVLHFNIITKGVMTGFYFSCMIVSHVELNTIVLMASSEKWLWQFFSTNGDIVIIIFLWPLSQVLDCKRFKSWTLGYVAKEAFLQ